MLRCSVFSPRRLGAFREQESCSVQAGLALLLFQLGKKKKKKRAVKQDRMEERSDTRGETQNFTFTQERGWKKVSMRSSEQFQVGIMHNHIK